MPALARKLRLFDYFALAFGAMIGAGWLVLMDDWLSRGGPGGIMLGFAIGTALLVPIGYVYGRLVLMIPDASSEAAYAARVFGPNISFLTGWIMTLAYLIVCPWEALAIGKMAAYFLPALNTFPIYSIGGKPMYLPALLLGLALTALLTLINFRGISASSCMQNWATYIFFALFGVAAIFGGAHGSAANLQPLFAKPAWISTILMLQIVPYFMTGFESVPKTVEESRTDFPARDFPRAIYIALLAGGGFYVLVGALVGFIYPWRSLLGQGFASAVAFEHAGGRWLADLIFAAAMISLVKVFNGNFVAASRLAFGMGRSGLLPKAFGWVHPGNQTPSTAIIAAGAFTGVTLLLGDRLLVAVTEVGSLASALGWLASAFVFWKLGAAMHERLIATIAILVALAFVLMKLLPWAPGHFSTNEYIAMAGWLALGGFLRYRALAHGSATEMSAAGAKQ
jgi:amino acid transporter